MLADYQRKQRDALKEAEEIAARAKADAERIGAQGARDLEAAIERRRKMAEEKIAKAEAKALSEIRDIALEDQSPARSDKDNHQRVLTDPIFEQRQTCRKLCLNRSQRGNPFLVLCDSRSGRLDGPDEFCRVRRLSRQLDQVVVHLPLICEEAGTKTGRACAPICGHVATVSGGGPGRHTNQAAASRTATKIAFRIGKGYRTP